MGGVDRASADVHRFDLKSNSVSNARQKKLGKTLFLEKQFSFLEKQVQFFKKLKKIKKKNLDFDSGLKLILDVPGNKISHTSMIRIVGKVIQTAYRRIINGLIF